MPGIGVPRGQGGSHGDHPLSLSHVPQSSGPAVPSAFSCCHPAAVSHNCTRAPAYSTGRGCGHAGTTAAPKGGPAPLQSKHPSQPVPKCHGHRGLALRHGGHSSPLPGGGRRLRCPQCVPISPPSTGRRVLSLCSALGSPPHGHLRADAKAQLAARLPWQLGDRNTTGFAERGGRRGHEEPLLTSAAVPELSRPTGGPPTPPNRRKTQGLSKLSLFQMLKDYSFLPLFSN